MSLTWLLIIAGFTYSVIVSLRAYRESGKIGTLFLPYWIDARSGVSAKTRLHGKIAFAILFVGVAAFLLSRS